MAKKSLTAQVAELRRENRAVLKENYSLRVEVDWLQMHLEHLKEDIARKQFRAGPPAALKAKRN